MMTRRFSVASVNRPKTPKRPILDGAFDFDEKPGPTEWHAEGLIPAKTLLLVLSQTGVGKSWFVEGLAVCTVYDCPFAGRKICCTDVLIIDEDTPTDTLKKRIQAFSKSMQCKRKKELYYKSHKGYALSDESLISLLNEYAHCKLVIVDCLSEVLGGLDINKDIDVRRLAKLKAVAVKNGQTLIITHHISEHAGMSPDDLMTTSDVNTLAMGSSAINRVVDTYFILASEKREGKLDRLYIRPVSKRIQLDERPFMVRLTEKNGGLEFVMNGLYEQPLNEIDRDIVTWLSEPPPRELEIMQLYHEAAGKYGVWVVRRSVKRLKAKGIVIERKVHHNKVLYRIGTLPKDFVTSSDNAREVIPRALTKRKLHARGRRR
jgi:hypothetical protein